MMNFSKAKEIITQLKEKENYDIDSYVKILLEINNINHENKGDHALKELSQDLRKKALKGYPLEDLMVEAFGLVREAARRVIGLRPFDVQIIAGLALHHGRIIEMLTGEGKTLAAVMPAYLNALTGKGVHILTFNDYLAERDAGWMGPLFEFLGLSCGYVKVGLTLQQRKEAYRKDITYVTAKEAGFDYLRDFLATEIDDLVHRPFNFAIIDEADSILIDEARVPLVIAGKVQRERLNNQFFCNLVQSLNPQLHYETDQYSNNVSLTNEGLERVEELIGCSNLYDEGNLLILTKIHCALHAEALLKKEVNYIVRNNRIEVIDEFTGRVAENRHWPDSLHEAVEAKEGLISEDKGKILASIPIQYFIKQYPKLAGMTGTAMTAKNELLETYGLKVVIIPSNKPSIRIDHPDLIFTHKEAKERALILEIKEAHSKGQPILIGTNSVEESEEMAALLTQEGIHCNVLNAKNDYQEAKIIARAGEYGAVTVSTNMAGRGVDIKLGGEEEEDKLRVIETGGLYVIGVGRHESIRIDNQLRGRAGRQGDSGESRFFISLEDEMIKKYEIDQLIPTEAYPTKQLDPIDSIIVGKKIEGGQRIIEGYNSDIRRQLYRYTYLIEEQRRILHKTRLDLLMGRVPTTLLANKCPDLYQEYLHKYGGDVVRRVEKQLTLYHINSCWADYLDCVSYIREGIHLVVIGGENPLYQFNSQVITVFNETLNRIEKDIIESFRRVKITKHGVDLEGEGLKAPSSTWTYLISDSQSQFSRLPFIIKSAKRTVKGTLFSLRSLY
ncbi:accessory Sec system translocase SecA2 [Alkaliphilus serpentinus]|uniref:Protein translocase subunit SecA n=1 Tax=Alkaliphilus serpentinus TaxID=1482731 RepID=A0A833HQ71_9FIRM|nr:accessory Sec system translocase SecA2 [Alkaliphilus serpentinus]KAB3531522.1 accessory Sec system translocase SecA2 [Alkaliphilus serpentinus]